MAERRRVVFVQTHPVQYLAPWFRWMTTHEPSIDLTVLYAVQPTPEAQAVGFGGGFTWDLPLRDGYANRVLEDRPFAGSLDGARFSRADSPALEEALASIDPHAVVVPGWHAAVYRRALDVCARQGWDVLYRGDSTHASGRPGVPVWARTIATRRRLGRFQAYLAVGTRSREYLLDHGAIDPLVFSSPHAVDVEAFEAAADAHAADLEPVRRRFGLAPGQAVVLVAGKLTAHKRPLDAIRAVAALGGAAQVLVAGAGPLEEACRAEAARLGVRTAFAGFLQPRGMADAYAAADVVVLPSTSETWGLVVNEALASGRPCIVSDRVGCAPDLIDDDTGGTFPVGDVRALADTLARVLTRRSAATGRACRRRARTHDFAAATAGVVAAVDRLRRRAVRAADPPAPFCVVACCGGMATPGGLERMTFEVLRLARTRGAAVHCIVNTWGSRAIVDMADSIDASWSTGYYWHRLERRVWHPLVAVRLAWDVLCTSAGLLRDAHRVAASAVLLPDHTTLLRNWPALLWLRFTGTRIVHRLGTPPEEGEGYRRLWRWAIAPVPHALVCNSAFTARALVAHDVPARKVMVAPNVLPAGRHQARVTGAPVPGRIVYAGQIIPGKGVHLLIEAVDRLVRGGFDVSLDVAGDIDGWESPTWRGYRARLRAQAAPLGARVRFLGWQADVPALLQAAWVHAAPSLPEIREGFGVVVLEAKAAGVPSVVGPSGALPELINEGVDGSVMPEATAGALADALVRWLDPAVRAAGSAAARRSLARWSPARFAETWDHAFGWTGVLQGALESRPCR